MRLNYEGSKRMVKRYIVHEYFGIDLEEIWNTVTIDIPNLKIELLKIIEELE